MQSEKQESPNSLKPKRKIKFDILSLFPKYFESPFRESIIGRAQKKGLLEIQMIQIRDFAGNRHGQVDDRPYGGGPGMVLMAEPVVRAIQSVKRKDSHVVYLTPQGHPLTAKKCEELATKEHIILLCGHYEGIDERAIELEVDEEISVGDYVLTSGCPAAITLVDATARFIPGVVGNANGIREDSFTEGTYFEGPQYTRPPTYQKKEVPKVLLEGHHAKIQNWRQEKGKEKTFQVRPELMKDQGEERTCQSIN